MNFPAARRSCSRTFSNRVGLVTLWYSLMRGVTVAPDVPVSQRLSLAVYAGIAENPRVVEDYVRYLTFRMGKEAD